MKYRSVDNGWFIKLEIGEEIVQSLIDFIEEKNIPAGTIAGIGALTEVELGYFNRETKEYQRGQFNDVYELLSLKGNIAWLDNKPIIHVHCLLGDADYNVKGGHLFKGKIAVTGEIFVQEFLDKFDRAMDPEIELNLLDF